MAMNRGRWIYAGALALFGLVLVRNAWMADDAFITLRSIDQFLRGQGLGFNFGERVQAYTHPLWLWVLMPAYSVSREAFYAPLLTSIAVSAAAIWVFSRRGVSPSGRVVSPEMGTAVVLCLLGSKAFMDYSTSGLENPLSHLLLALFFATPIQTTPIQANPTDPAPKPQLRRAILWASLLAVNRLDAILLVAPSLLLGVRDSVRCGHTPRSLAVAAAWAASPLLLWLGFSLVYYGTIVPNTAFAKLGAGVPSSVRLPQGFAYLAASFRFDLVTPLLIVGGLVAASIRRRPSQLPVATGVVLYLAYTVWIGGDFMLGRYLAAPLLCSLVALFRADLPRGVYAGMTAAAVVVSLLYPTAPLRTGSDFHNRDLDRIIENHGIADERAFYYQSNGLLSPQRDTPFTAGSACRGSDAPLILRRGCSSLGIEGLRSCPGSHLVDSCALSDPLLARLPAAPTPRWRVGHNIRPIPVGYLASLRHGVDAIEDPSIRELYADVRQVVRGPVFTASRFRAIWRLHFHDYGI
ncbi:MAG: hypothetical protein V3T01_04500 [Myxococcota bacterium]